MSTSNNCETLSTASRRRTPLDRLQLVICAHCYGQILANVKTVQIVFCCVEGSFTRSEFVVIIYFALLYARETCISEIEETFDINMARKGPNEPRHNSWTRGIDQRLLDQQKRRLFRNFSRTPATYINIGYIVGHVLYQRLITTLQKSLTFCVGGHTKA